MPLPSPKGKEEKNDFISRCMGSSVMKNEFPEQKQRTAVCFSQWRKAKKKSKSDGTFKDFIEELQKRQ